MRKESSEGRKEIYAKIDSLRDWAMSTFVTRELYQEKERAHQAELMRMDAKINALQVGRHSYHLGDDKGGEHGG